MMFVPPSLTPLWEGVFAYFATNFQNFPFSLLMTWVNGEKSWSKLLMEQYKYHRSAFCDEYITVALVSWCREKVPSAQFRQLHCYVEPHSKPDRNKQGILLSGLFLSLPSIGSSQSDNEEVAYFNIYCWPPCTRAKGQWAWGLSNEWEAC